MITFLIYTLIAFTSFSAFLWVNKKWLEWIMTSDDDDEANVKLAIAVIGSIAWPIGIPIFLVCIGVKYIRENCLP